MFVEVEDKRFLKEAREVDLTAIALIKSHGLGLGNVRLEELTMPLAQRIIDFMSASVESVIYEDDGNLSITLGVNQLCTCSLVIL